MNPIQTRPVYLAGPVDESDDPSTWRDEIKAENPDVDFVCPVGDRGGYGDDPSETIEWCLRQASWCDVLVGMLGRAETVGTHYEVENALAHGRHVVVHAYDLDEVSTFVLERPEILVVDELDDALDLLLDGAGHSPSTRYPVTDD